MKNSVKRDVRESVHLLSFVSICTLITNDSYLLLKIRPVRPLAKIFLFTA